MKKTVLIFLFFISGIFLTAQAGYVIRGITTLNRPSSLINFTLSLDTDEQPIAAASMHTALVGGAGDNTIVIVHANNSLAQIFPIASGNEQYWQDYNIEVRDFQKVNNMYVLCGSRGVGSPNGARAFVAVIDANFSVIEFQEYPEAEIFYSIYWGIDSDPAAPTPGPIIITYYVCGKKNDLGVIASINSTSLQFIRFFKTEISWEYHKIIRKDYAVYNDIKGPLFVVSGRNPECNLMGFTVFDRQFRILDSYFWKQNTEMPSLCVVSDYDAIQDVDRNKVIFASSYQNTVSLYPLDLSNLLSMTEYRFVHLSLTDPPPQYYIQDINTCQNDISVAGYMIRYPTLHSAWHGIVYSLSGLNTMRINTYNGPPTGSYEHHKIKTNSKCKVYTGGYFKSNTMMCVLFATPLQKSECDNTYVINSDARRIKLAPFYLREVYTREIPYRRFEFREYILPVYEECPIFKNEDDGAKSSISDEKESEIATFYDRITVKNTPNNTNYTIYSVTGQLVQTGTTNPDISTAQLSKGIYILRLENGKAFKFVK